VPSKCAGAARPYDCRRTRWTSAYAKYTAANVEYSALPKIAVVRRTPKSPRARKPAADAYVGAATVESTEMVGRYTGILGEAARISSRSVTYYATEAERDGRLVEQVQEVVENQQHALDTFPGPDASATPKARKEYRDHLKEMKKALAVQRRKLEAAAKSRASCLQAADDAAADHRRHFAKEVRCLSVPRTTTAASVRKRVVAQAEVRMAAGASARTRSRDGSPVRTRIGSAGAHCRHCQLRNGPFVPRARGAGPCMYGRFERNAQHQGTRLVPT
jgi:hypothetical protein